MEEGRQKMLFERRGREDGSKVVESSLLLQNVQGRRRRRNNRHS
jgi:hypothetical protein